MEDQNQQQDHAEKDKVTHVSGMFENWFLDYASYVILERAVPALEDGLKPVQRRILHSMNEMDDGRYSKVANIIGNTMKYHPHGDASITDAMVGIGQKDLLIDTQGNWGNILTGDGAAAARYIEARLTKFAHEVVFNPKTTNWQLSYDGRNKEPINFPVKFPLLLAQGVEGIAVGLACKILPHNFNELIDASIASLKGKKVDIYPDFPTGGLADFTDYKEGLRGGKIKVRARVKILDKKTLVIHEIPFGTTTSSLMDSIVAANDKGKIKVRKIEDNTAENVEILVHLVPGISPDQTIDALYAFTDCELSISPNACVIENDRPLFIGVNEMLKRSAYLTKDLLQKELEIEKAELEEAWHFSSLEKIFIKEEMYIDFKKYSNKETLYTYLYECFKPHRRKLMRDIVDTDLDKLVQIPMLRITRFDSIKADEKMKDLENRIEIAKGHLASLTEYTIDFYKNLKKKYGEGRERKTEMKTFDNIQATQVVIANEKLYINRAEGFIGYGLKKDEYICDCSDIDDVIVFRKDGVMKVVKISDKVFVGKDILYAAIFKKNDERTTYNMIYRDGPKGATFMKRFNVTGVTRDKDYELSKGEKGSEVLYFTVNPNGEAETVSVYLRSQPGLRKLEFDVNFADMAIKARGVLGNLVTKYPVKKIAIKTAGTSTLAGMDIWFDENVHRLNKDGRGTYIGKFNGQDKIFTITSSGFYKLYTYDLLNHFDEDIIMIEKYYPDQTITSIYYDGESNAYFIKRFVPEPGSDKKLFITEHENSRVELVTNQMKPKIEVLYDKRSGKDLADEQFDLAEFVQIMGWKAKGKRLTTNKVKEINLLAAEEENIKDQDPDLEETGLSPVEMLRKAMSAISSQSAQDFIKGIDPGEQTQISFD
jgi:topoisomerase IV subunit A